jgi:hypothetical protein
MTISHFSTPHWNGKRHSENTAVDWFSVTERRLLSWLEMRRQFSLCLALGFDRITINKSGSESSAREIGQSIGV